ncbi:MAG: tetratricopeptide repeat protein [Desulfovibrionales bacterium]|nr:tetratricopeptide repeat protein [Desulfovibrionales bacterium]
MTTSRATQNTSVCVLIILLMCCLGCASRNAPVPQLTPVAVPNRVAESADAQAIYNYLAYRAHLGDNEAEQAIASLEHTIAIAPTQTLYLELGNLYWQASRFSDAQLVLKNALATYPDSTVLVLTLAKAYASQGRFDDAVLTLDDFYKKHPHQSELILEAAAYRIEQRQFGDAVDRLSALPKDQISTTVRLLSGKALLGLGLQDKAIAQYQQAINENPDSFDAWVEMGLAYESIKNYVAAEQAFSHVYESGAENSQIIFRLIDLNIKLNNPDKAVAYALEAADELPLVLEAANLLLSQDFYDQAAQLLDPVAEQEPIPADALFYLAILEYQGRDNLSKALEYLADIPRDHPHFERSLIFGIHLLYQDEQTDKAIAACRQGMELFPHQPEFYVLLGEILDRSGDTQGSLDILFAAANHWPENTQILYRLGLIYEKMDHPEQAMVIMEKIIALDPQHADALNYLGYTLAVQEHSLERAEVLVQSAISVKPDNGYFIDSLAWIYFKQNKIRQAWHEIQRAVHFVDSDPIIWEHYGDIAQAMSLPVEARKGYTKALALHGSNEEQVRAKINAIHKRRGQAR